jgi:hypothetical protein
VRKGVSKKAGAGARATGSRKAFKRTKARKAAEECPLGFGLLAAGRLEEDQTTEGDRVAEHLEGGDLAVEQQCRRRDEQNVLEDCFVTSSERGKNTLALLEKKRGGNMQDAGRTSSQGEDETRRRSNEEHSSDVERKRDRRVGEHDERSHAGERVEGREALGEGDDAAVDGGADGGVVVQRDEGVHLEAVQEKLDHDETRRLELKMLLKGVKGRKTRCYSGGREGCGRRKGECTDKDGQNLADEPKQLKVQLSVRGERATSADEGDDARELLVGLLQAEGERDEENGDRGEGL